MPLIVERGTCPQEGIGKPDYTREVSSSRQRTGLTLKYLQSLGGLAIVFTDEVAVPYEYAWVQEPLAAGATASLFDQATGVQGAYTVPAGYTLTLIQWEWNGSEDIRMTHWLDGYFIGYPAYNASGDGRTMNIIRPFSTAYFDAIGATSHTWEAKITNLGTGPLIGLADFIFILEAVGTEPLPGVKECRCSFCHHLQAVPVGTTYIICKQCGKLYIVMDYSRIKEF